MRINFTKILLLLAMFASSPVNADTYLCAKKTANVANGKVKIARSLVSSSSACSSRYRQVFQQSGSSVLYEITSVDGSGSGLDADTLDGLSSADFASASDLTSITTRVSDLESETQDPHVLRVSTSGGDYSSLSSAIAAIRIWLGAPNRTSALRLWSLRASQVFHFLR